MLSIKNRQSKVNLQVELKNFAFMPYGFVVYWHSNNRLLAASQVLPPTPSSLSFLAPLLYL